MPPASNTFSAQPAEREPIGPTVGPLLYLQGQTSETRRLSAIVVYPKHADVPELFADGAAVVPRLLLEQDGQCVYQYRFSLQADYGATYWLGGEEYSVSASLEGDIRIAYVSCNGQELGDRDRPLEERNALWRRLTSEHDRAPFQLLLHGGDQIYADEILDAHPLVRKWADGDATDPDIIAELADITQALRGALFQRYLALYGYLSIASLMARVPSLAIWDDHDICDGWGSLPPERQDSAIAQSLFAIAREYFLIFQMGTAPGEVPECCLDPSATSLTWHMSLPDLDIVAPDLRSERRPDRVMGPDGWTAFEKALDDSNGKHMLVLSSVPALGPRLSWIEALMKLTPVPEKYEDDLRDQWQSRAHRREWERFLRALIDVHRDRGQRVTLLSGEIHLATRGYIMTRSGALHQLVASGIAHPPPPDMYARVLSWLARLGEAPLPDFPIRLVPLPGKKQVYTAQRNYLVLERQAGKWQAWWELEHDGPTPALVLN